MTVVFLIVSMLAMQSTSAITLEPGKVSIPTYAYVNVAPNPAGLGQTVTVNFFLDKPPSTADGPYGDRWHNLTVTVTKPDGTTENLGPFKSDATGGTFTHYTPEQIGNYSFQLSFPGQFLTGENPNPATGTSSASAVGNYFQSSTSDKATLVVQETAVQAFPTTPLPSEYWTRPIFAMNTEWNTISGNWLGLGATSFGYTGLYNASSIFNPYTKGPNTAHILWTKPYAVGGLIGGEFGNDQIDSNFKSTSQYEPQFAPIIINGVLYYQQYLGTDSNPGPWVAIDLQTGKTLWTKDNNAILTMGQILDFVSPNQFGGMSYLWGQSYGTTQQGDVSTALHGAWSLYDATTGNWILDIENGTTYDSLRGIKAQEAEDGSILIYYMNYTDNTLNCWNSSKAIQQYCLDTGQIWDLWYWRTPQGAKIDWNLGIQWTKPAPTNISGAMIDAYFTVNTVASDVVLLQATPTISDTLYFNIGYIYFAGYNANTGELIWGPKNQTELPYSKVSGSIYNIGPAGNGLWMEYTSETFSWNAYSLVTGKHLWGPVSGSHNAYSYQNIDGEMAYGTLYAADLGGYVNAFNLSTGKLLWTWNSGSSGTETPYGNWPLYHIDAIADGKIYVLGGHTYSPPLFHGAQLYCLNATTGSLIWSINDYTTTNGPCAAIADGVLIEPNAYDNQIYAFGVGPTRLTVNAPAVGVTTLTPITISGTITDISSGADQLAVAKNFPNGLPCVSDASMTEFMEAIYQQQPMPTNLTGVPITINVVDANGNYRTIGTTVSNAYGTYSFTWTPDISGDYTVIATFEGTESYYASNAAAAFHASEQAPTATPQPTQAPSMADLYFMPMSIAIIIAVIVGIAISLLVSRKHP
jgi:hypothetical protein